MGVRLSPQLHIHSSDSDRTARAQIRHDWVNGGYVIEFADAAAVEHMIGELQMLLAALNSQEATP